MTSKEFNNLQEKNKKLKNDIISLKEKILDFQKKYETNISENEIGEKYIIHASICKALEMKYPEKTKHLVNAYTGYTTSKI